MSLLFDHVAHEYFLDGPQVPSNTGILRGQGLIRFDGVPPFILERARTRGGIVHRLIHYDNENDLDEASVDPAYKGYVAAWRRCRAERGIVALACEYRVASRRHRVAGTLDLLCECDGEGWLLDYCTGDLDKLAKHLQTAGYLGMVYEWAQDDSRLADVLARHRRWRRAGVRLRPDGTFRFVEYDDASDYAKFLTLAAAWHIRQTEGVALTFEDLAA